MGGGSLRYSKFQRLLAAGVALALFSACGAGELKPLDCKDNKTLTLESEILSHSYSDVSGIWNGSAAARNAWLFNSNGSNRSIILPRTASAYGDIHQPTLSPGGTKILGHANWPLSGSLTGTAVSAYNLWLMNVNGTSALALTQHTAAGIIARKANMSRDGSKIVFESNMAITGVVDSQGLSYNIWIVNSDGTGLTALTRNTNISLDAYNPSFSPDGTKIVFYSSTAVDGSWNGAVATSRIWVMNIDGTSRTLLTGARPSIQPSFSPDGSKIVFQSTLNLDGNHASAANASYNVWTMNASDGSGLTAITQDTAAASEDGSYSPNGEYVVYRSKRNLSGTWNAAATGAYNVWVYKVSDGTSTALTQNTMAAVSASTPYFSADSSFIVFPSAANLSGVWDAAAESSTNIWKVSITGSGLTALTRNTSAGLTSSMTNAPGATVVRSVFYCR